MFIGAKKWPRDVRHSRARHCHRVNAKRNGIIYIMMSCLFEVYDGDDDDDATTTKQRMKDLRVGLSPLIDFNNSTI